MADHGGKKQLIESAELSAKFLKFCFQEISRRRKPLGSTLITKQSSIGMILLKLYVFPRAHPSYVTYLDTCDVDDTTTIAGVHTYLYFPNFIL